jgi:hypothetical protein
VDGETVTEVTTGAETVTADVPDFVVSATLVAVTVSLSAVAGAVYRPADVMVPWAAFQVTDLLVTVPAMVAVNCAVALVITEAVDGETVTEVTTNGAVTVTLAEADLVLSA